MLVDVSGGDDTTGKNIAMHIAAGAAPGAQRASYVTRAEVPLEQIAKEREILAAQAAESGKPKEMIPKIVEGQINKYLAAITLLGQPFVMNPDETVEKFLKSKGATVNGFVQFVVGEGIEKKKDDFAQEVAALAKA